MNDQVFHTRAENRKMDTNNNRLNKLEHRVDSLQERLSWIQGKLDGKQQSDATSWSKIAILVSIWSTIIALLAYFK